MNKGQSWLVFGAVNGVGGSNLGWPCVKKYLYFLLSLSPTNSSVGKSLGNNPVIWFSFSSWPTETIMDSMVPNPQESGPQLQWILPRIQNSFLCGWPACSLSSNFWPKKQRNFVLFRGTSCNQPVSPNFVRKSQGAFKSFPNEHHLPGPGENLKSSQKTEMPSASKGVVGSWEVTRAMQSLEPTPVWNKVLAQGLRAHSSVRWGS